MSELVLHHYPSSPFSEKVRLILGYKKLAWRSVIIPVIMPKPDVIALTGGYRKTPLLQIGGDVYCDTALIARVLDGVQPDPPLYPREAGGAEILAQWADSALFWHAAIPYTMQPAGMKAIFGDAPAEAIKAFAADRAPFTASLLRQTPADAAAVLHTYLGRLESQIADTRSFMMGGVPSIADFSVAHCVWYVHRVPELARIFESYPRVAAWYGRVKAFSHGDATPLRSGEALALAAQGERVPTSVDEGQGFRTGEAVTVTPIDYGRDPSAGTLVGLSREEIVIRRNDDRAGVVHLHFPRIGFQIRTQEKTP
jgi:glutathione S-transferase